MATSNHKGGSKDDIINALEDICSGKRLIRKVELRYGVPKSTFHDHATGQVEVGKRQGQPPILRREEQSLVNWAVEMNNIGYGQTRRQICEIVKKKS